MLIKLLWGISCNSCLVRVHVRWVSIFLFPFLAICRWPFGYGNLVLPLNAGLVGLVGNSFFRRMLKVRQGLILTSLPSALLPALVMTPAWMGFITKPILLGDLQCSICADIRGGLVNFLLGEREGRERGEKRDRRDREKKEGGQREEREER